MTQPKTAWMWVTDSDLFGASLDTAAHEILWILKPGCDCGDETHTQSFAEYEQTGLPVFLPQPPDDVIDELEAAILAFQD